MENGYNQFGRDEGRSSSAEVDGAQLMSWHRGMTGSNLLSDHLDVLFGRHNLSRFKRGEVAVPAALQAIGNVDINRERHGKGLKKMLRKYQLKNGMKVLTVQSLKSPVVSVQMWVRTGSADENKKVQGISHFIEHLVFKGTEKFGLGQIAATVEGAGGELNAYTTFDQTVFYVTISRDYLSTGLEVISQMMGFPQFDAAEIDNEREVVIEEIKRGNDSLHRQASRALFETVYKKHPYGKPVIGYEEIIRKVTRKEILDYYHSRYVPKNMTLVVAGDFQQPDLKKQIDQLFGKFKPYPLKKVTRAKELPQKRPRVQAQQTPFKEDLFYSAWPIPGVRHKDIPALEVLGLILGQGESSRLNRALRLEKPLVNYAGASSFTPKDPGFFALSASLTMDKLAPSLATATEQILRLRTEAVTQEELVKAQTNLASEEAYSLETVDGLARKVGTYDLLFDNPDYQKKFLGAIQALTSADLKRVVEKYLRPSFLSAVLLTHEKPEPLQKVINQWVSDFQKQWKQQDKRSRKIPVVKSKLRLTFPKPIAKKQAMIREVLPSGVVLLQRPNYEAPVVSLRCGFMGGVRMEGFARPGLTELLSRTWVAGTAEIAEHELYGKIEGMASSLSAFGGRNTIGLSLTTLPGFGGQVLDILDGVLFEPVFPEEAIHREKLSMYEALRTREDNTAQTAILNFMKMMFAGHPYSIDPLGSREAIESYTQAGLSEFLSEHRKTHNCVVAISGFYDEKHLNRVRDIFSRLRPGSKFVDPFRFEAPRQTEKSFTEIKKEQSHLVIGYAGLSLKDPRRYALQVVQAILAGQGGRLFLELRDKASLAYSVSPLKMEGTDGGYFGAYIGCSPEKTGKALSMLRNEFDRMVQEQVGDKELLRAQKYLIGRQHIDHQRNSAICSSLLFDEIYGLPYDESFHFAERIHAVTVKDIRAVAEHIFSQKEIVSVVGPVDPF